jgi:hypothetical protein
MKLEDFKKELVKEAEQFEEFWKKQQCSSDNYPMELPEDEWWDQFNSFQQVDIESWG